MKKKEKLALIDNYVELHRIMFQCKNAITHCNDIASLIDLKNLSISLINLKELYEKTFQKLRMLDDSLILLKQQLESSLKSEYHPPQKQIFSHEILNTKKDKLYNELIRYI